MGKNIVKLNETQLRNIVAESVKKVLNEAVFGQKILDSNEVLNGLNKIAQNFGHIRVKPKNGTIVYYTNDRNGEQVECQTNIAWPKTAMSGMFGTGTQGYDPKSYQVAAQQLQTFFQKGQQIHNDFMKQDAAYNQADKDYQYQQATSPEAIQKQREKRWAQDAATEKQWNNQRQMYRPTGDVNNYRG